ncbi:MAG: biotin synthase BioB [Spirochaetes bacterium GWF1_41_5]|nr:MAG: biotin synthase BioB [Spirochaetes bacterium GWF1_41_5]
MRSKTGCSLSETKIRNLLSERTPFLQLMQKAFILRQKYFGRKVRIHILDNVQSGSCSEDCRYCRQSRWQKKATVYPMKSEKIILAEAAQAYRDGAFRHCMVFSGRDAGENRILKICRILKKIKKKYAMKLCVSAGFLTKEQAVSLKKAGADRYNHNINTSHNKYSDICSSHDYQMRVATINNARAAGLSVCSGVIIGMGETVRDLAQILHDLSSVRPDSIPVNFFIPFAGHRIKNPQKLTPEYCLRILCIFRLAFPDTEIRIAGGREIHLGSLQALSLFAANSLFARGYLTIGGESMEETRKMIKDAGFTAETADKIILKK